MEEGRWITINGSHVFVKDGQSPIDALVRNKNKKLPNSKSYSDIAYHASNSDFDNFDVRKTGTGQGENTQGEGINLASIKEAVEDIYGKNLYEVKVDLKNAYTVEDKKMLSTFKDDFGYEVNQDNISKELKKMGYDGIVQNVNGNKLYTVFDGKNVKIIKKKIGENK